MIGENDGVSESDAPTEVRIRRAPRIGAFLVVGAALAALVTLVLTSLFPADPSVGFAASYAYFLLFGIPAGLLVGGIAGVVADAVSARRARTVSAEREVVAADARLSAEAMPEDSDAEEQARDEGDADHGGSEKDGSQAEPGR